jgi:hypothetical protein
VEKALDAVPARREAHQRGVYATRVVVGVGESERRAERSRQTAELRRARFIIG